MGLQAYGQWSIFSVRYQKICY